MQVLTAGILRKAALVKRQILSQRELGVNTWKLDSSPALVTSWGVGIVLSWGFKSALSPWWLCSVQVVLEQQ